MALALCAAAACPGLDPGAFAFAGLPTQSGSAADGAGGDPGMPKIEVDGMSFEDQVVIPFHDAVQCWHWGHQYVMRCPITCARIGVPHALQGSPARPYTDNSCSKYPGAPSGARKSRSVVPPRVIA